MEYNLNTQENMPAAGIGERKKSVKGVKLVGMEGGTLRRPSLQVRDDQDETSPLWNLSGFPVYIIFCAHFVLYFLPVYVYGDNLILNFTHLFYYVCVVRLVIYRWHTRLWLVNKDESAVTGESSKTLARSRIPWSLGTHTILSRSL